MDKIIIFGCGNTGKRIYQEYKKKAEVIGFYDNDPEKWGMILEIDDKQFPVYEPSKKNILEMEFDYIVLASVYGKYSIKEQLIKLDVPKEKIQDISGKENRLPSFLSDLSQEFKISGIKGACAEVGVFRGDSAEIINRIFPDRKLHLFDTFDGFDSRDIEIERINELSDAKAKQYSDTSVELVIDRMPHPENIIIHKGYFPETAEGIDEEFSFVRLDLDLFLPTEAALDFFVSRMTIGGIILVHDYFGDQYSGIQKAVNQFIDKYANLRKMPIGDALSIAIVGF